jgi:hypothetical protein
MFHLQDKGIAVILLQTDGQTFSLGAHWLAFGGRESSTFRN